MKNIKNLNRLKYNFIDFFINNYAYFTQTVIINILKK